MRRIVFFKRYVVSEQCYQLKWYIKCWILSTNHSISIRQIWPLQKWLFWIIWNIYKYKFVKGLSSFHLFDIWIDWSVHWISCMHLLFVLMHLTHHALLLLYGSRGLCQHWTILILNEFCGLPLRAFAYELLNITLYKILKITVLNPF